MNIKPLKATILRHFVWPDKVFFNVFLGTIISFTLSFYISNYLYFLSIPLLLLCLHLLRLSIVDAYDDYLRYCRDEEYMSDGSHTIKKENRKYIVNLLNGKRHGSFIEYFINGQIKLDYNYKNGEIGGVYKSYYENGQIEKNCNYINGKFDGPYKSYYENGNLMDQLHYKNGNKDGQFQSFYDNKAKYREGNFGEKELVKEYFKNGNLKFLKENNKYTFYDKDYNLKCEIHSTGNDFIGTWKNYREDGTIEYELDFDDTNSDVKNNKVSKAIFTKGGDFYTKIIVSYKNISGSNMLYGSNSQKRRREGGRFNQPRIYMGPPDAGGAFIIDLKPISSIEDIIKLIPIKQSMDAPLVEAEDSNLYDVLRSVESSNPDRRLLHESLRIEIERDLENLTPREADVVRLYFGLGNQHPMSLEEIGETFDLTRERVRQIKEKAIRRIKHTTRSKILKTYLG